MKRAFILVQEGRSVKSVAAELNIPEITSHDQLKMNSTSKLSLGRKSVFSPEQEVLTPSVAGTIPQKTTNAIFVSNCFSNPYL